MQIKQSQAELEKIMADVSQSLKPAVFVWSNANVQMISGHAAVHFATNGVIDLSFANLRKAITALRESLSWVVPPAVAAGQKPVYGAEQRGLKNHASKDDTYVIPEGKNVLENARKHALAEASATILMQCVREIESYRGTTHSGTAKGRAILKEMLDKTTRGGPGSVTPDQALHLLDQIKAKAAELYDKPSY